MKSFFKRIGKAIKSGFQKIGKFFNSKIGRIIGTVMMAWSIGSLFKNLFSKAAQKTVEEGAKQAVKKGVSVTPAGEAAKEVAKKGAEQAASKITLDSAGKIAINSTSELASVSGELLTEGVSKGIASDGITTSMDSLASTVAEKTGNVAAKTTEAVVKDNIRVVGESVDNLIFDNPNQVFDKAIETGKLSPNITPETLDAALKGTTDAAQNNQLAFIGQEQNLPTNVFGTKTPLTQQQLNAQTAWNQSTSAMKQDFFANSANRELYAQNFEGLTSTFKAPAEYGAREFSNLGEAFTGGKNLLESTANVGKHVMETSIGELSGGRVGGFLGRRGAAGTAYTTASTAASLLAEPPEQPYTPNYQARSVARELGQAGETIAMQPLAQGPAAMYGQVDFTSPDYYKQIMQINNNAGMSYAYGGGGINVGRYG